MFGLFKKDPIKKLQKEYTALMEKALHAQRNGDIEGYARLSQQADDLSKEMDKLNEQSKNS